MGKEQSSDYYDNNLERVSLPLEESPWREVYETVVDLLPPGCNIIDIGCGTGRCAEAIRRSGISNSYFGFDFSDKRIAEARNYVPSFEFQISDALTADFSKGDTFVITEVLEHIEADLEIISRIPTGSTVIFSVPNFDSAGHVRYFDNIEEVYERYSKYLNFDNQPNFTIPKPTRPHKLTFVLKTTRL